MMSAMVYQLTSLAIVYSTVSLGADQRKPQGSTSLTFVRGIHRWLRPGDAHMSQWVYPGWFLPAWRPSNHHINQNWHIANWTRRRSINNGLYGANPELTGGLFSASNAELECFFFAIFNKLINKQRYRWFKTPWRSSEVTAMDTKLTPTVLVAKVRKPPNVSQSHTITNIG